SWAAMLGLGLWHGVNPGMGWLFAVALGMQEQRASAVWRSLPPLAAGHALAVGAAVLVALLAGRALDPDAVRWAVAAALAGFGAWRLIRGRHPRWVGMRVSPRELATWSLLMASAHGAGLMVMPFVLEPAAAAGAHHGHGVMHAAMLPGLAGADLAGLWATLLHTAGYLLATGGLALLVYRKLGLRRLKALWVNLDLVWGVALVLTGLLTPLL
ncbi:MAG TPA: hypothetical protein VMN37_09565, partial [Gemmatimonadales bacterium]|nr:hypothetical protein [Gemmatimonadales bacterium]